MQNRSWGYLKGLTGLGKEIKQDLQKELIARVSPINIGASWC